MQYINLIPQNYIFVKFFWKEESSIIEFTITPAQAQDFASSCFEIIISEIKDAYEAGGTENPDVENRENDIAA